MDTGGYLLAGAAALTAVNLVTIALAAIRVRRRAAPAAGWPAVSVVVPLKGIETFSRDTLRAAFSLDFREYELLFCVADENDPIVPLVRDVIARHPERAARLLVGADSSSPNPKLNNCLKGWAAARHDWIVLADSNVLMPPDYLQQLLSSWRWNSGLVCSPPRGAAPANFWSEVECAFLNTLQARWQFAAEAGGLGFAQGKSMLWNRRILETLGGLPALAAEIAEDAAATKLVRAVGLKVHLAHSPFAQPLGPRSGAQIWSRQARWARLRRVTFPILYVPELLISAVVPAGAAALAAAGAGLAAAALAGTAVLAVTYLAEAALARSKGWWFSWRQPAAMLVRDIILLAVWVRGFMPGKVMWQGTALEVSARRESVA